jgi:hypothetical protein
MVGGQRDQLAWGSALLDLADWTGAAPGVLGVGELALRPTGFTVVAGSAAAYGAATGRLRGNAALANVLAPTAERPSP